MNTFTRRLTTAAAGVALAASAAAVSGPAAFAAKPSAPTTQPLSVSTVEQGTEVNGTFVVVETNVDYVVPESYQVSKKTQCRLDAVKVRCNEVLTSYWDGHTAYQIIVDSTSLSAGSHTFTVQVTTKLATYAGSVQVTGSGV